jgi:hypothetical protein
VSPIFVDNKNNNQKGRKTIRGTIKLSKERASERKLMIIVISSARTLFYTKVRISVDEADRVLFFFFNTQ